MNYCEKIEDNIDCNDVLRHFGITPPSNGKRIPCPIHRGDDENFSVHEDGKVFTCWSRGCGEGLNRGAVTLYCMLQYGAGFRDLDRGTKYAALKELCALSGVALGDAERVDWDSQRTRQYFDAGLAAYLNLRQQGLSDSEIKAGIGEIARGAVQDEADAPASSWLPVTLDKILSGEHEPEEPAHLRRNDGISLLYRGRVHSIHGESESGKSWVALIASAEVLSGGGAVAYLDYESDAGTICERLRLLGVSTSHIMRGLTYVQPESAPSDKDTAFASLMCRSFDLAVIDGVSAALATCSGETKDTDSITSWFASLPRPLARKTGASVLLIDHVTKNKDSRGRFAIGSQAKMAALDGAAYCCEPIDPLAPGKVGKIELRIAKDRPGAIRAHCTGYSSSDRTQLAARITIDSTSETIKATIEAPDVSEPGRSLDGPQEAMKAVLKALASANAPMSVRGIHKECGGTWDTFSDALRHLTCQQFIERKTVGKNKKASITLTPKGAERCMSSEASEVSYGVLPKTS